MQLVIDAIELLRNTVQQFPLLPPCLACGGLCKQQCPSLPLCEVCLCALYGLQLAIAITSLLPRTQQLTKCNLNTPHASSKQKVKKKKCNDKPIKNENNNKNNKSNKCRNVYILSANVNGLRGKLEEIRIRVKTENPHVIACQETKIGSKVKNNELYIPDYDLIRKDRTESGGGVALYVNKDLKPKQLLECVPRDMEIVAVKCHLHKISCILATVYRPPRQTVRDFMEGITSFICALGDEARTLILTGDTNICALSPEYEPRGQCVKIWN
jgi:hypothetical protein